MDISVVKKEQNMLLELSNSLEMVEATLENAETFY